MYFKGVHFKDVLRKFSGCFKELSRKFQVSLKTMQIKEATQSLLVN